VRERDIRLFEIGTVFETAGSGVQPKETLRLAGLISGARAPSHWSSRGASQDYDLWDLKNLLQEAVSACGPQAQWVDGAGGWVLEDAEGRRRGWGGLLTADNPAWAAPVFGFEIDLEVGARTAQRYTPVPVTPPVERDLALVLPAGVRAEQLESVMKQAAGDLLETVDLFDEYTADDLSGRSLAWRLVFRAPERTLKDKEVDRIVDRLLKRLKEQTGAERRQA
jgi:phenylalanyl-tRNA synthetase beta chain